MRSRKIFGLLYEELLKQKLQTKPIKSLRNKSTFLSQTFIKPGSPLCFYLSDLTRDDIQQLNAN